MTKTIRSQYLDKSLPGYWVGSFLSGPNRKIEYEIARSIKEKIPDTIWLMQEPLLHITLFEIVTALENFTDQEKDNIYEEYGVPIIRELDNIFGALEPVIINFKDIEASRNAIIIKGEDNGTFQKIRDLIMSKNLLPKDVKDPPNIIHSTIARYTSSTNLSDIQEVISELKVDFQEVVTEFEISKISRAPMDGRKVIRRYPLLGSDR